jgi:exodeoxyribonuclease VIII
MSFRNCRIVGTNIDADAYHRVTEQRGSPDYPVSPSMLRSFSACQSRWLHGYSSPDSDAKDRGRAVDSALLTPKLFAEQYVVRPDTYAAPATHAKVKAGKISVGDPLPWNSNAAVCSDWIDAAESAGKTVLSSKESMEISTAVTRLKEDETIASFVDESEKQVLAVGEWHDESGVIIPVRCLIDLQPWKESEFAACLGDLKTTRNAAVVPFQRQTYQLGWHIQAAFDIDLYNAATGGERSTWCFIVQENYPPFQPAKRMLSQEFRELGQAAYRSQLGLYCRCLQSGRWPGYDDHDEAIQGWSLVAPEPWMGSDSMFAPRIEDPTEELETVNDSNDIIP